VDDFEVAEATYRAGRCDHHEGGDLRSRREISLY
jgi:hypothetical protein